MTKDEILAMPAGPELNELIAVKAMGWRRKGDFWLDRLVGLPDSEGKIRGYSEVQPVLGSVGQGGYAPLDPRGQARAAVRGGRRYCPWRRLETAKGSPTLTHVASSGPR